jgi:hypothetical protein
VRYKLAAIGIIAVLLCATMPLAVSAAPTTQGDPVQLQQKPILKWVYSWNSQSNSLGPVVGWILILSNGHYVYYCTHLAPNTGYTLVVVRGLTGSMLLAHAPSSARGTVLALGAFDSNTLAVINWYLSNGGAFVIA